ncbi:DUF2231 domain-containing protein [Thermoactinospora rubra]|uniref:DUF2231 domain-containing protein n=1 Tax=Thermoactinospora rubra TaxID=1088767 RepID=UPI000A0FA38A|nr:DUF2231 domain-containing protein [Thermoactinospora rubra]
MRLFSFRPALTIRGRTWKGLRGMSGKPLHPPLTDVPVGAVVLATGLDVVSVVVSGPLGRELYRAGTFVLVGGVIAAVLAAVTGAADWLGSTPRRTQAWRTVNAHALVMAVVTVLLVAAGTMRLTWYADDTATPLPMLALSVVAAGLTVAGGAIGGSLVYDYGFNVEVAGDSPVWHESAVDRLPGESTADSPSSAVP